MFGTGFSISVDQIVFLGIGFLACAVLALTLVSPIHARAVRLTEKKLAFASPMALEEIRADKDRMRASFAMSARRLETSIDELKDKTSAHMSDLARKSNVIAKLKTALEERDAAIAQLEEANDSLEVRVKALFNELQTTRADAGLKTDELAQAERVLAHSRNQVQDLRLAFEERERLIERQSGEIAALKAHIETVRSRIAEFTADVRQSESGLTQERGDLMRVPSPSLNDADAVLYRSGPGTNVQQIGSARRRLDGAE